MKKSGYLSKSGRYPGQFLTCLLAALVLSYAAGQSATCIWPQSAAQAAAPNKQSLHRIDMQIAGSSCATCLIRLEKKLKVEKGVLKVVVSIFKPFKAALIYDDTQTNWQTINKVLAEENVTAANLVDSRVKEVPLVLQPK